MLIKSKKIRRSRLSNELIISHLKGFYVSADITFNKFCERRNVKVSNLGKIFRSSGLSEMKRNKIDVDIAVEKLKTFLDERDERNSKKMNSLHKNNAYLTDDELLLVANVSKILGAMGYGMEKLMCLNIISSILKTRMPSILVTLAPTLSVVDRMMKKNKEIIQLVHGNAIDPARIRQSSVDIRDAEFFKIEQYVQLLYKMGKIPWKTYKEIPKRNLYNADKVATNTYDHRRKVIGSVTQMGRVFQITPGGDGRMPFHITSMLTSCASGQYKVPIEGYEGAPPPMIIHSCSASPEKDNPSQVQTMDGSFFQRPRYSDGLGEPYSVASSDEIKKNPWGFCVRTSASGSMTQRTFFDYCIHFVKNIPQDQGKEKQPVLLFLDGHSSRWDVSSLLYLLQNNVYPFFLPSHTSV